MFFRVLLKSIINRKLKVAVAVVAVSLGASVLCALMSLSLSVNDKIGRELKSYGANLLLVPESESVKVEIGGVDYTPPLKSNYLDEGILPNLKQIFWKNNIMGFAPYLYAIVELPEKRTTLPLAGSWFDREMTLSDGEKFRTGIRSLSRWWQVDGDWVNDSQPSDSCMIGSDIAKRLGLKVKSKIRVRYSGDKTREKELTVVGLVQAGGFEDGQIFAALETVQALTGAWGKVSQVQLSVLTIPDNDLAKKSPEHMTPQEYDLWYCSPFISSISYQIQDAIPGVLAKPVEQVAHAESNLMKKIGSLMILIAIAALIASGLGVMSTMTTIAIDRRSEVGLMKALGAEKGQIMTLFLTESTAIGLAGGSVGYGFGVFLAQIVGKSVFNSAVSPSLAIVPFIFALSAGVSILGSAIPVKNALKFEPIFTLRGK